MTIEIMIDLLQGFWLQLNKQNLLFKISCR